MPTFVYRAVTDNGKIVRNQVEELSRKSLINKLKRNNLTPINIVQINKIFSRSKPKQKKNVNDIANIINNNSIINNDEKDRVNSINRFRISSKIKVRDLIIFTQDLYLLKKANFNNIHALNTIIENTENNQLREIIKDILAGVESGENMYTTMEYYAGVFPYLYINMVKVGELSGELTRSLKQAVEYLNESSTYNKKIKKILIPNLAMFIGINLILVLGVIFILPLIQNLFKSMGAEYELPAITVFFSNAINILLEYWYIPIIIIVGIIATIISYINTPKGKYNFDYFKYKMPLFGKLIFSLDFLRFSRAMLLNLNNGIRIQDSLETSKNVVKNYVLRSIIESSINNILLGQSWIEPFEKSNLASTMMIEMLNIGMQTDLREMMQKLLEYIQIDIDNTLEKVMKALPEIVYAIVGIALIFVVLVVLVPCIDVYMGKGLFEAAGV